MKAIWILGPFWSWKTHTLAKIARIPEIKQWHTRVAINDVLAWKRDSQLMENLWVDFGFLTGGCIGCNDRQSFIEALEKAKKDNIDYFLFEQPWTEHGQDLKSLLKSQDIENKIFCLWDGNIWRHIVNSANRIIQTSLQVADIIWVTKLQQTDEHHDKVMAYLAWNIQWTNTPITLLSKNDPRITDDIVNILTVPSHSQHIPSAQLSRFVWIGQRKISILGNRVWHQHSMIYPARIVPHEYNSKEDIIEWIWVHGNDIERLKWVCSIGNILHTIDYARWWNVVIEQYNQEGIKEILIYWTNSSLKESLLKIGTPIETKIAWSTKEIMSESPNIPSDILIQSIQYHYSLFPEIPFSEISGEPLADFWDADLAYQQVKDIRVPETLRKQVIQKWIQMRMDCLDQISKSNQWNHLSSIWHLRRRLWANLAWHAMFREKYYIDSLDLANIITLQPCTTLLRGLLDLEKLSFDENKAEERPEFLEKAFEFGMTNEWITIEYLHYVIHHLMTLAWNNQNWKSRYEKLLSNIDNPN